MGSSLCLFGAVARRDFGPQLTKRFLDFLARCIGHDRNWTSLIRRQLPGGHDDTLDVRARLGENVLHIKIFAHGSSYYGVATPRFSASHNVRWARGIPIASLNCAIDGSPYV
jgi:hypothetical protein